MIYSCYYIKVEMLLKLHKNKLSKNKTRENETKLISLKLVLLNFAFCFFQRCRVHLETQGEVNERASTPGENAANPDSNW